MNYKFGILGTVAALALWKFLPEYPVEKVGQSVPAIHAAENTDPLISTKRGAEKADEPCSAYKFWAESQEREVLNGPLLDVIAPASLRRRAEYVKFLDSFWSSVDAQITKKKPETVGDVFGDVQTAYVAASAQYGKVFRKLGVTTRLQIRQFPTMYDPSGGNQGRLFTLHDLQHESMVSDSMVQKAIAYMDPLGAPNTFDIRIRFIASSKNYQDQYVIDHASTGLSKDSPSVGLITPLRDDGYYSQALRRVLTCALK